MAKLRGSSLGGAPQTFGSAELAELYAAHRLSLVRLALLLVDDLASAEDVVQDAFAAMAARRGRLDDSSAALACCSTATRWTRT